MHLPDTEKTLNGASSRNIQTDDFLRSEDYEQTGTNSPFSDGESAIPPVATGGIANLSVGNWLLVQLILAIPIVNLIMLLVWAIGEPKPGKELLTNYSRASLIWMVISFIIGLVVWVLFFTVFLGMIGSIVPIVPIVPSGYYY